MRIVIVDDEPPARRELRRLLSDFPWIDIVGESGNIMDAAAKIEELAPVLLFLDIFPFYSVFFKLSFRTGSPLVPHWFRTRSAD